jgi:hypothetical protein
VLANISHLKTYDKQLNKARTDHSSEVLKLAKQRLNLSAINSGGHIPTVNRPIWNKETFYGSFANNLSIKPGETPKAIDLEHEIDQVKTTLGKTFSQKQDSINLLLSNYNKLRKPMKVAHS